MRKIVKKYSSIIFILILLCTITISAYAYEDEKQKKEQEINQNENIVLLGDSLLNLYNTRLIYEDLPVVNSGISGHATEDVLKDMEERVYKYNPTKIFILIGINDIYYKRDFEEKERINQTYKNITTIVDEIKKHRPKCEIYVMSLLPINDNYPGTAGRHKEDVDKINEKLKSTFTKEKMVTYVDINDKYKDEDGLLRKEYTTDGLHLSDLGYAKLTEILMKYIY